MLSKTKLKFFIYLLTIFFSWVNFTYANLEISEIMYSPESGSDYEWIEIYNNGSTGVDLNKYRFFHGETNSGPITLKIGNNTFLQPSKYAIIAKSLADYSWLGFSDMVYSSSVLSLPDTGDNTYIAISDSNKTIIDSIGYDVSIGGSKASKSSLSKINREWVNGIPTPGKNNQAVNGLNAGEENLVNSNNTSNYITSSNISNVSSGKDEPDIFKITTKIISPKIVIAGIPFSFSSLTNTNRGETYAVGKYIWNFGDGMVVEAKQSGPFEYTYEYPGEYSLSLSYYENSFIKETNITNRIIIKVIPSEIYISSVGDDINPFIELENKSAYEIVISNWIITAGSHYFIIPQGMTILPDKKIKLSPKITGFTGEDIKSVIITNINKEVISKYPIEIIKPIKNNISVRKITNNSKVSDIKQEDSLYKDPQVINLNDLAANAAGSESTVPNRVYPIVGLIVIIGLGIAAALLIKRKDNKADYMENDIRPEDMTIIE
jgi:hypothetical protein